MTLMHPHVMVVEDDADLRRLLGTGLAEEGFRPSIHATGRAALEAVEAEPPDLAVIDIGLPDADGRDLCQALRARGVGAPVLFLTARDAAPDRVSGFSAGGDDYLTKPFVFAELVARLCALARRGAFERRVNAGDLDLDPISHSLGGSAARSPLTPTEFRLLGALASRPGEVLRRREMIAAAWPTGAIVHDNTLDVYIARLRKKIAGVGSSTAIHTVHGVGYRLG